MKKKILIIGGVAGGASCAARIRRLNEDADITIFEQGPYISFANCGLPYHIGKIIPDSENLIVATPEMFEQWFNIEVRTNTKVTSIDKTKCTIEVANLVTKQAYHEKYDILVISTGAKPKIPPIEGINLPGVFTLRNIPDTLSINSWIEEHNVTKTAILGGGFIGLELAENLAHRGIEISIIEAANHLLPFLDNDMALMVQKHLIKMGIHIYLDCYVNKFEKQENSNKIKINLSLGKIINSDMIIISTGVSPESEIAVQADLEIGKYGGIKVNEYMQTSSPKIWAVGDVIEVKNFVSGERTQIPLAGPANRQGRIAAESIVNMGKNPNFKGFRGTQGTGVCGLFGMTVASTGLTERQIKRYKKLLKYEKIHVHAYNHAEYYPNAKKMTMKLIFSKQNGLILGAQAVGKSGVEKRIDVIAMAIQNKSTVFDIAESELCYSPQYGSAKDIVNISGMVASNVINGYFDVVHWDELNQKKNRIILDVREDFVYNKGHVSGAISIPLEKLRERLQELEKEKEILVYCLEGKRSYYACRILNQRGFKTKSISGGYKICSLKN